MVRRRLRSRRTCNHRRRRGQGKSRRVVERAERHRRRARERLHSEMETAGIGRLGLDRGRRDATSRIIDELRGGEVYAVQVIATNTLGESQAAQIWGTSE